MKYFIALLTIFTLLSCQQNNTEFLSAGTYRAELQVQDKEILPFLFKVKDANTLEIYNADEVILVDEIKYKNKHIHSVNKLNSNRL